MKKLAFALAITFSAFGYAANITTLPTPSAQGASMSRLYSNGEQSALSWVETEGTMARLRYATLDKSGWSKPIEVASGSDWFNNWADYPSVLLEGDSVVAHWLQKTNSGKYDYRVRVSYSEDGGKSWAEPFTPHTDGVDAEHGFVSMLANGDSTFITWLDGRHMKPGGEHDQHAHHHDHGGAMTLRAATFQDGKLKDEWLMDERVCECCTTSAANTTEGIIVAYRDRSEDEIRDISVKRLVDGEWRFANEAPKDNWKIAGCPVNGPSLAASEERVALTWFTASEERARVQLALSEDSGNHFSQPILVSDKTIGRVDSIIHEEHVVLAYLAQQQGKAALTVDRFTFEGDRVNSDVIAVLSLERATGFPNLGAHNGKVLVAWNQDRVHSAEIDYRE